MVFLTMGDIRLHKVQDEKKPSAKKKRSGAVYTLTNSCMCPGHKDVTETQVCHRMP